MGPPGIEAVGLQIAADPNAGPARCRCGGGRRYRVAAFVEFETFAARLARTGAAGRDVETVADAVDTIAKEAETDPDDGRDWFAKYETDGDPNEGHAPN